MAANVYLFLDGIPGESTAVQFRNWIDLTSFSVGVTMEVDQEARTGSGGGTSGAADPEDFPMLWNQYCSPTGLARSDHMGIVPYLENSHRKLLMRRWMTIDPAGQSRPSARKPSSATPTSPLSTSTATTDHVLPCIDV